MNIADDNPMVRFYAARLAKQPGGRVRSIVLRQDYLEWAAANEAPDLSFREIRRVMIAMGHRHFQSSLMFFADVAILSSDRVGDEAETFRLIATSLAKQPALHREKDRNAIGDPLARILRELRQLRREVRELRLAASSGQYSMPFNNNLLMNS
jgi:hypothetical protein